MTDRTPAQLAAYWAAERRMQLHDEAMFELYGVSLFAPPAPAPPNRLWPKLVGGTGNGQPAPPGHPISPVHSQVVAERLPSYVEPHQPEAGTFSTETYVLRKLAMKGSRVLLIVWRHESISDDEAARLVWSEMLSAVNAPFVAREPVA